MSGDDNLLTINEVAEQLNATPKHVWRLVHSGALPGVDVGRPGARRRTIRIRPEDVKRFVENRTEKQAREEEEVKLPPSIRHRLQVARGEI